MVGKICERGKYEMGSRSPREGAILRGQGLAKVPELQSVCGGDAGFLSNYSDHIL